MNKIQVTLTEDQLICIVKGLEAYRMEIKENNWDKTGLTESVAFIKRLQSKIRSNYPKS